METGQPELVRLMLANLFDDENRGPDWDLNQSIRPGPYEADGRSPIHEAVLIFQDSEVSVLSVLLDFIKVVITSSRHSIYDFGSNY